MYVENISIGITALLPDLQPLLEGKMRLSVHLFNSIQHHPTRSYKRVKKYLNIRMLERQNVLSHFGMFFLPGAFSY